MSMSCWKSLALLLVLFCALLLTRVVRADLEVWEARWGFDGRRVYGAFNPLTITLHNPDEVPFEGVVRLTSSEFADVGGQRGAALVRRVYLSPGATRREQFYPLVRSTNHVWTLTWGRDGHESDRLEARTVLRRARVVLLGPDVRRAPEGLRGYSVELFPRSAAALEGLAETTLDHDPDWDSFQRAALVDWVVKGGTLHVLRQDSGEYPRFTRELAILSGDTAGTVLGSGKLVYHDASLRELTPAGLGWKVDDEDEELPFSQQRDADLYMLDRLRQLSEPEHNWPLIYAMSLIYLVLVVPVNLIIGRKVRDYRWSILFLVGCVALFSAVFFLIGRRGFGEQASIFSYTVAEVVPGGHHDVHQYVHAFVTLGGDYTFRHDGSFHVYGTPRRTERVPGAIVNGPHGQITLEMPLYSSREYLHHSRVAAGELVSEVLSWPGSDAAVDGLELAAGAGYPEAPIAAFVVLGERYWILERVPGDRLRPRAGPGRRLSALLDLKKLEKYIRSYGGWPDPPRRLGEWRNKLLSSLRGPQVARVLDRLPEPEDIYGNQTARRRRARRDDGGRIHIFVEAPTPAALHPQGSGLEGFGHVLYHQVLVRP